MVTCKYTLKVHSSSMVKWGISPSRYTYSGYTEGLACHCSLEIVCGVRPKIKAANYVLLWHLVKPGVPQIAQPYFSSPLCSHGGGPLV